MKPPRQTSRLYFLISLAFHLMLVILWALSEWGFPTASNEIWEEPRDNGLAFELIEIPDDALRAEPDKPTNLVSDKSTRAADMNPEDTGDPGQPYSVGDIEFKILDVRVADNSRTAQPSPSESEEEGELGEIGLPERGVDYLAEMRASRAEQNTGQSMNYENLASSAERRGGLSFNTYNWDFAPYMLAMKRKVQSNLHPPYAFTHMGAVSGTAVVRFIVEPDGTVRNLAVLESDAHFSLDHSSVKAIELSAPFLPLPRGFPEDYLEVTAHFSYVIDKRQ
jgi:TonB family protein